MFNLPIGYQQTHESFSERILEKELIPESVVLAIPLKNGGEVLPRFLPALEQIKLPSETYCVKTFVLNGSTDNSRALLEEYLERNGSLEFDEWGAYINLVSGNQIRIIIEDKASKAGAMNLASKFAESIGVNNVASLDVDTFPDPYALYEILKNLHNTERVLSFANITFENKNPKWKPYNFAEEVKKDPKKKIRIAGNMVAWKVDRIKKIGGWPITISDDYSMSVLLRDAGLEYGLVENAKVWGYRGGNERDLYIQQLRFYTGFFYSYSKASPNQKRIMEKDHPETVGIMVHLKKTFDDMKINHTNLLVALKYFTIREKAIIIGYLRSKTIGDKQTWDNVKSTI